MSRLKNFFKNNFKIIISCLLIVGVACASGIAAHLADSDSAVNKITIGSNRIKLVEDFLPPPELGPGVSFTKNVTVENVGPSDCYVRVMAAFTTSDMEKYCVVDWNEYDAVENPNGWIFNAEDEYWYYPHAISEGESTPSLFTKVTIKETYDFNGDGTIAEDEVIPKSIMQDFDIIVYAESYQSYGFEHYTDAWANYQANMPER